MAAQPEPVEGPRSPAPANVRRRRAGVALTDAGRAIMLDVAAAPDNLVAALFKQLPR